MVVSTGNVSQSREKTCKSIYTSAVVTRLDIFDLRGKLCHRISVSRETGFLNQFCKTSCSLNSTKTCNRHVFCFKVLL